MRSTRTAAVALLATGVALTGLTATGAVPAQAGPGAPPGSSSECPLPATVAAGDKVTGRTVSTGTVPESFDGQVLGVVEDLIAPDFDLVMVRLTSTEIDRIGGIWAGMSGSPVYDSTGKLVGAVSYGMSYGASPVAGVTPAAEMQRLLTATPGGPAATRALSAARDRVDLPRSMERTLVAAGAATAPQAQAGMTRLPVVVGVSGPTGGRRLDATLDRAGLQGARVVHTASTTAAAPSYPIVSGGNLAAALSYGDYTAAALGTATAVCGSEILAFGHPFQWTGASSISMHGASAVYVQEDPAWTPYKVANLGAPRGTIVQDRLAGLLGITGATPPAARITSTVTAGGHSRTGRTTIVAPELAADMAAFHLYTDQLRVLDAHAKGSSTATWRVSGTRTDGTAFSYLRSDRFASPYDIVWSAPDELYMQLSQLLGSGADIRFTRMWTSSAMGQPYQRFAIAAVKVHAQGAWRALPETLRVRPGTVKHFRVTLTSRQRATKRVLLDVRIPATARRRGSLSFVGGDDVGGWEDFWEQDPASGPSFGSVLRSVRRAPRNDQVVADLSVSRVGGGRASRSVRVTTPAVVGGYTRVNLQVVR